MKRDLSWLCRSVSTIESFFVFPFSSSKEEKWEGKIDNRPSPPDPNSVQAPFLLGAAVGDGLVTDAVKKVRFQILYLMLMVTNPRGTHEGSGIVVFSWSLLPVLPLFPCTILMKRTSIRREERMNGPFLMRPNTC